MGLAVGKERTVCVDLWDLSAGAGRCLCGGGCPPESSLLDCRCVLLISGRDSFGPLRLGKQARGDASAAVGRVDCTAQGRGRLSGLCLFNVTVIVKLEAVLWGNVPQATGGAVVVNLA